MAKPCHVPQCFSLRDIGIYCTEHAPPPLPTLVKRLPGYMCPDCPDALRAQPDDMVGCSNGHLFERDILLTERTAPRRP